MRSAEELYATYKVKLNGLLIETEAIPSENWGGCPFRTSIDHSHCHNETCTLMERGIKPYREIENHRFDVKRYKHGVRVYYRCCSKSGEECLFLKRVNRIAKRILTTIDKKRSTDVTDNELMPYLRLHNLLKKLMVSDYDDIIRRIAEYCFINGGPWVKMEECEVNYELRQYVKRIMRNIKEATVIACFKDKRCPYKTLVSTIVKST